MSSETNNEQQNIIEPQLNTQKEKIEDVAPQSLKLGINEVANFYYKNNRQQLDQLLKNPDIAKLGGI